MKIRDKDIRRFWKHVDIRSKDECWEWQASGNGRGYGRIKINQKMESAHRVAWEIYHRMEIPKGLYICHHCDNTKCVNPFHLFIGTQLDNMADCAKKGRLGASRGEDNPRSILTKEDVLQIKEQHKRLKRGEVGKFVNMWASKRDVTVYAIWAVITNKSWKHIDI